MRLFSQSLPSMLAVLWVMLATLTIAQQLKLNYFSDHLCGSYQSELKYYWADGMNTNGGNCYNYNYGNSMLISDCYAGSFCMCQLYYSQNCQGDYASIQSTGYDRSKNYEYNCLFNTNAINSIRCYHY